MIAIPKRALVVGGIIIIAGACVFLADRNGYHRAVAKYNAEAAQAADEAKRKQAEQQKALTAVTDEYYKAIEGQRDITRRLDAYKKKLRGQPDDQACNKRIHGSVLPAVYRMFNEAADHPDLPTTIGTRQPDAAGDGLEAIQACFEERHRYAIQVNTLQGIIRQSDCFISDN